MILRDVSLGRVEGPLIAFRCSITLFKLANPGSIKVYPVTTVDESHRCISLFDIFILPYC